MVGGRRTTPFWLLSPVPVFTRRSLVPWPLSTVFLVTTPRGCSTSVALVDVTKGPTSIAIRWWPLARAIAMDEYPTRGDAI
jgi:hypothetical protein